MVERYTLLNNYYILDNKIHNKLSQKQTLDRLNQQEHIIQKKTEIIKELITINNAPEQQEIQFELKPLKLELEPINLTNNDEEKIKQQVIHAIESLQEFSEEDESTRISRFILYPNNTRDKKDQVGLNLKIILEPNNIQLK